MKNLSILVYRCLCFPFSRNFRSVNMWWKSAIANALTRFNALNRSRQIIVAFFVVLLFLYFLLPKLFGGSSPHIAKGYSSYCIDDKLDQYQDSVDVFDAVLNYVPPVPGQKNYPPYAGNGYIAASYDSQNGLYIRLNRALSLPVKYYPVVDTTIDGLQKEEVNVLQLRSGLVNRIQGFKSGSRCVTIESQMYAHRTHPSMLIQEIRMHNPTRSDVLVDLDQVRESGWADAEETTETDKNLVGDMVTYTLTSGLVKVPSGESELYVAVAVASTSLRKQESLPAGKYARQHLVTTVQYSKPMDRNSAQSQFTVLKDKCKQDLGLALKTEALQLRNQHTTLWGQLWQSGFSISLSRASGALNGDKINSTIYYVLSNTPAPLHDPKTEPAAALELRKTLHYPDKCYNGHTSLHSTTLWADALDEDNVAQIVTTWIITLEKQGCNRMIAAGVEGVLQAMLLSIGSLRFGNEHLEMGLHPKDTHRDFNFHRINYGNNTHLNISILVGADNKANIFVSLDRNDKPYYACDAACLDPPIGLSKTRSQFPVKLTEPLTSILYITADLQHINEYKHAIHVKEIAEAPAHEHHVIALHRHGHHFGGLPTIFWVSIAFLVIVFHLFLFKLIYNEYCQAQERFTKSRYHV